MNLVDIIKKFLSGPPKNDDLAPDVPERTPPKLDDLLAKCDPSAPRSDEDKAWVGSTPPAPIPWSDLISQAKEAAHATEKPSAAKAHARSRKQPQARQKDGSARKGR